MKLTIERAALVTSLAHVHGIVERRTTIPILSNVRLEASDGKLAITATDMDLAVVEAVPAAAATGGAITAPAHLLHDIVRKLPEGAAIEIETSGDDHIALCAGQARFSLPALPADEFPVMAEGTFSHDFSLPAAALCRLIDKTRFAISTEETRYYLNGIYLHAASGDDGPALRAVATDGHRLARVDAPLPEGADGMPGVIVPRKAVAEVRKLIEDHDGEVAVSVSETKIRFAFGDVVLISKLIDGTFPDYARVIPGDNDKVLEIDGKLFTDAVDRVATISTEKTRSIKLNLTKGRLVVSANSPDSASATEELAVAYDAPDLQIGFNARYLLDMASEIDGESLRMIMNDAVSPTVMRDPADSGALFVLMPMRV